MSTNQHTFVGIDGCPSGWVAVVLREQKPDEVAIFPHIGELWEAYSFAELILIDMPIGLPEPNRPRRCEGEARQRLKPYRSSSIFPVPIREVLHAVDYPTANQLQRDRIGKGLSRQTWGIVPKIRELDELLQKTPSARGRLLESHPELCFASWYGSPMRHNKKTEAGFRERIDLLSSLYPPSEELVRQALADTRRSKAARDDIIDAMILAVTAMKAAGRLGTLPADPEHDNKGLLMQIVYPSPLELQPM